MKIIQVTDPHLVPPGETLWALDASARFDRCLDDIERWHSDAEFCVISGDLTDRADPSVYQWLRDRLEVFPLKTFLMIGNHDDREVFRSVYPKVACDPSGFVQQSHKTRHGVFLFLDTNKRAGVSEGQYCEARHSWLKNELEKADGEPTYIFMHHPPCDIGIPYMDRIKLEEPEAFADTLATGKNIRHIFFGHVHRSAYVGWQGIPCTCLPGTNHQVPLVRASVGTAYSQEPPGYGVVFIDASQVAVHFDAYLDRFPVAET
jgi:3',5'-cyclic-AMP phosphodiesterase